MCSNGQQRQGASALLPGDELELVYDSNMMKFFGKSLEKSAHRNVVG